MHTSELGVVNKLRKREITVSRVFAYVWGIDYGQNVHDKMRDLGDEIIITWHDRDNIIIIIMINNNNTSQHTS